MIPPRVIGSYFDATVYRHEVNSPEQQPPGPASGSIPRPESVKKAVRLQSPIVTPELSDYVKAITSSFLTPAQNTSTIIAAALKQQWKIEIDPNEARIATFNYHLGQPKPAEGKLLNSITLTEAALTNMRDKNPEDETAKVQTSWWRRVLDVVEEGSPLAMVIKQGQHIADYRAAHEYIIPAFNSNAQHTYHPNETLHPTPQAFRDLLRQTELSEPYKAHLDKFWPAHEDKYTQCSKFAFAAAAQIQHKEGSLSNYETSLVMRAAGFGVGSRLSDMTAADLTAPFRRDSTLETGLLSINGSPSTDLVYVTDKRPRMNGKGQKINHTLLYIPGNSSPIHRFDSVAQMKGWLADQAADPNKRAQLSTHFKGNDQDDKVFSDGVKQALKGLGGWSEAKRPNKWGFESPNEWDPQTYITTEPVSDDPFRAMTLRQKARSYADAGHDIVTDADVTKRRLITLAEAATTAALMLTPLAMVIPEVAIAAEAVYVAAGAAEIGVGIDDAMHGKSTATDRTVFGLLNAVPTLFHASARWPGLSVTGLGKLPDTIEKAANANKELLEFEAVFDSDEVAKTTDVVELAGEAPSTSNNKRVRLDESLDSEGAKRIKLTEQPRELNKLNDLIFTFVDTYNGAERLNIVAHGMLGNDGAKSVAKMVLDDVSYDADELTQMLWDNNVPTDKYANIRLLMCDSGTGGDRSFAAQFQENVGVPVKAYASKVNAEFTLDDIEAVFTSSDRSKKLVQFDDVLPAERRHRVVKKNPYSSDIDSKDYEKYKSFSYEPVHFPPRSENPKQAVAGASMPAL
ncbi:Dermonecrotic toxin [Pseudomonas extremaustralis]|uniref:Dermonecrotic toxin n=1 Tax=Pseudomonas extremaustralis TaxID=359110 RepID=A0A5M9J3B5_9PSED|nr:Dermonecrotic toxin [Pseudomonas extremaustralis]